MKRLLLLASIIIIASNVFAQDDVYFTPKKKNAKKKSDVAAVVDYDTPVYHSGSNRDVDEYNRRGAFASHIESVGNDSTGNDIIEFTPGDGTYPDSISLAELTKKDSLAHLIRKSVKENSIDDEYNYSRRLRRFDGFYAWGPWGYDPWFYDPWYFNYAYDPWYWHHGWYDPWYRPWHYDPWYWHHTWGPWHHYYPVVHISGGSGTHNHGSFDRNMAGRTASSSHGVSRGIQERGRSETTSKSGNFSGRRGSTYDSRTRTSTQPQQNRSYESTRSNYPNSSFNSGNFSGGGGFSGGGSRGGGFSGGGGSRGGGVSFGGRR